MNARRFRKMVVGVLLAGVAVSGTAVGALQWRIHQAVANILRSRKKPSRMLEMMSPHCVT